MPYNSPLPRVQQLNVPGIYMAAEKFKGMRNENRMAEMAQQKQQTISGLMPQAAQGDEGAMTKLAGIAPEEAAQIMALQGEQRKIAQRNTEAIGQLLYSVEQTPGMQRPQAYQAARAQAEQWGLDVSQVPEQYDPQYTRFALARFRDIADMLDAPAPEVETFYDEGSGREYKGAYNPQTRQWDRVGGMKSPDGDLTTVQRSNNAATDTARQFWRNQIKQKYGGDARKMMNAVFTLDPITKGLVPKDKALGDMWTRARNRKVGDDPDFEEFMGMFMPSGPPPPAIPEPSRGGPDGRLPGAGRGGTPMPAIVTPRPGQPTGALPPGAADLPPNLQARLDRGEIFTDQELTDLFKTNPAAFRAFLQYVERQEVDPGVMLP